MSPDTMKAIEAGAELTDGQIMELIEAEAREAGFSGAREAIERNRAGESPRNFLELDLRLLLRMLPQP